MARWWPQVRAALVAFHLVAITLSAIPSPEGGMNRANWADPTVQAEFTAWAGRFGMAPKVFEDRLWEVANLYGDAYKTLLTPIRPYEDLVGAEQSWKMFVAPHRFPTKLQVSGRAGSGEWRVLFEESSSEATWRAELLRIERLRSAIFRWGWPNYASSWSKGCTAIARLAFADMPDLTMVRCRMWKAKSPSPAEVMSGSRPPGAWTSTRLSRRGPDGNALPAVKAADEPVTAEATETSDGGTP